MELISSCFKYETFQPLNTRMQTLTQMHVCLVVSDTYCFIKLCLESQLSVEFSQIIMTNFEFRNDFFAGGAKVQVTGHICLGLISPKISSYECLGYFLYW